MGLAGTSPRWPALLSGGRDAGSAPAVGAAACHAADPGGRQAEDGADLHGIWHPGPRRAAPQHRRIGPVVQGAVPAVPSMRTLDEEPTQALLQAQPNCFFIKTSGPTFVFPVTLPYIVGASVEYSTQDNMHNASGVVGCPGYPDTQGDAPLQARSTGAETLCLQAAFPGVLGTHNFPSVPRASVFRRTAGEACVMEALVAASHAPEGSGGGARPEV